MTSAKTLTQEQLIKVLEVVSTTSKDPLRDCFMLLASHKQGMRACEIARLRWADVTDAEGSIARTLVLPDKISKNKHGATLPLHKAVYATLTKMRDNYPPTWTRGNNPVVRGRYQVEMTPNYAQKIMKDLYTKAGLEGVSSHSGRRTYITSLARKASEFNCSIKDVQTLARHANMKTTELYIEASEGVVALSQAV